MWVYASELRGWVVASHHFKEVEVVTPISFKKVKVGIPVDMIEVGMSISTRGMSAGIPHLFKKV